MIRIVVVDDEKRIRSSLINVLKLHYPGGEVVGEADDVDTAVAVIKKCKPDVILLDIKMPGGTSFDMLKQLMPVTFKIIFITAFDQYAIPAFKFSAIDYLLKPVIPEELVAALRRTEQLLSTQKPDTRLDVFMSNLNSLARESKKVVLNSHDKMYILGLNEIIRCEADRNYTLFVLLNKKSVLVSRPLKEYEDMLEAFGFFRCHNSHLVNLFFVDRLEKKDGGILVMKDGSEVLVSARKYTELIAALNQF